MIVFFVQHCWQVIPEDILEVFSNVIVAVGAIWSILRFMNENHQIWVGLQRFGFGHVPRNLVCLSQRNTRKQVDQTMLYKSVARRQ